MIRLFSTRQSWLIPILFVAAVFMRASVFITQAVPMDVTASESVFWSFFKYLHAHRNLDVIVSFLLVFVQGLLLSYIFEKHNVSYKNSYLPTFFYIIICSMFDVFLFTTPALVANTFLILALDQMFVLYKSNFLLQNIFNAFFFSGLSVIIFYKLLFLYPVILISITLIRITSWRDVVIGLIGFILPFYFILVYYYAYDEPGNWLMHFSGAFHFKIISTREIKMIALPLYLSLLILMSLAKLYANFFKNNIKTRVAQQSLFFYVGNVSSCCDFCERR